MSGRRPGSHHGVFPIDGCRELHYVVLVLVLDAHTSKSLPSVGGDRSKIGEASTTVGSATWTTTKHLTEAKSRLRERRGHLASDTFPRSLRQAHISRALLVSPSRLSARLRQLSVHTTELRYTFPSKNRAGRGGPHPCVSHIRVDGFSGLMYDL